MNWEIVSGISGGLTAVAVLGNYILVLTLKAEIATLRADLAKQRAEDHDKMREWINGSFLRAAVVRSEIEGVERRVDRLEGGAQHLRTAHGD